MMRIDYCALTDVGRVRSENQDTYGLFEAANLYFVCDGMGGGAAGDFASRCAANVITHAFTHLAEKEVLKIGGNTAEGDLSVYAMRTVAAIRLANRTLYNLADKYSKLAGMGTTVAAILIEEALGFAHIYHVGDSRVYRFRDGCLELLTKDHSKINELLDEGKMQSEEVKTAEIQSMITRAVGTGQTVKIDYRRVEVRPNDYFVLCSDGLNGEIDDDVIMRTIAGNIDNLENMVYGLIGAANSAGGKDNTTAIAVRVAGEIDAGIPGADQFPEVAATIPEETPDQLSYEDGVVRDIISAAHITVPKSALETGLYSRPLLLSAFFLILLLAIGYMVAHRPRNAPDTALTDLSGSVTGIHLFIRTPTREQWELYKKAGDDTIQKLQIVQDWMREPSRLTESLESVQMIVLSSEKEAFKGISSSAGTTIKIPPGTYWLTLWYPGYSIITDRTERRDTIELSVESAAALKPMTVIMLPAE